MVMECSQEQLYQPQKSHHYELITLGSDCGNNSNFYEKNRVLLRQNIVSVNILED